MHIWPVHVPWWGGILRRMPSLAPPREGPHTGFFGHEHDTRRAVPQLGSPCRRTHHRALRQAGQGTGAWSSGCGNETFSGARQGLPRGSGSHEDSHAQVRRAPSRTQGNHGYAAGRVHGGREAGGHAHGGVVHAAGRAHWQHSRCHARARHLQAHAVSALPRRSRPEGHADLRAACAHGFMDLCATPELHPGATERAALDPGCGAPPTRTPLTVLLLFMPPCSHSLLT